jgi:DNA-binding transcriptional LysR family regulator
VKVRGTVELRHLRYFVGVAEALSFRKAARRLSASAAALSQQVADLENELGLKLLNRNSRRVELTEVGRVFLAGARRTRRLRPGGERIANRYVLVALFLFDRLTEHRWPAKRARPKLADFREDNFLTPCTEAGDEYMHLVRTVCQREAGFEPNFLTLGNSLESLLSMVAAGRGVSLSPEILSRHRTIGVSFHVLDGLQGEFEMLLMRRKSAEPAATLDKFVKILAESLLRLQTPG